MGEVRNITHFGAFVRLINVRNRRGDGLVHISQLKRNERVSNPNDVVQRGMRVKVKVLSISPDGKIALSMKAVNQRTGQAYDDDKLKFFRIRS